MPLKLENGTMVLELGDKSTSPGYAVVEFVEFEGNTANQGDKGTITLRNVPNNNNYHVGQILQYQSLGNGNYQFKVMNPCNPTKFKIKVC